MKTTVLSILSGIPKALIVFFAPIKFIIILVAISTVIDTLFGFWKAFHAKEKITSKKWRFGFVPKTITYIICVMLVYSSDYFIINEIVKLSISVEFLFTKLIALILISIEVKSMDESFKEVKGWSFLEKLQSMILKAKNIRKEIE